MIETDDRILAQIKKIEDESWEEARKYEGLGGIVRSITPTVMVGLASTILMGVAAFLSYQQNQRSELRCEAIRTTPKLAAAIYQLRNSDMPAQRAMFEDYKFCLPEDYND